MRQGDSHCLCPAVLRHSFLRAQELLLPEALAEEEVITQWLSGLKGARVCLRVPKRVRKRLVEMVERTRAWFSRATTRQERSVPAGGGA